MTMESNIPKPWGYRWRSSKIFILGTITIALFAENFLYGFVIPILSFIIEVRLGIDQAYTQRLTTASLTIHGIVALVSSPIIGHYAEKASNRKVPLLASLGTCLIGTALIAYSPSVWALFLGRIFQGLAGSAAWIVGLATLADNVPKQHMGRQMGWAMSFVTAGVLSGPLAGGVLLELVGYWPMWSMPILVLFFDIIARFIMIEKGDPCSHRSCPSRVPKDVPISSPDILEQHMTGVTESSTLLHSEPPTYQAIEHDPIIEDLEETQKGRGFYRIMLSDGRVLAGLFHTLIFFSMISGFNNTVPLHVRNIFGWGSLPAGMIFFGLQGPSILLAPAAGWLYDRVGLRYPTMIGWVVISPLLWLISVPGESRFPWASLQTNGPSIYISSMVCIGIALPLVRGAGTLKLNAVAAELELERPSIFGPRGAKARTFSLAQVPVNLGIIMGPMLSGALSDTIGYYWMNLTFAAICLTGAASSFWFLDGKPASRVDRGKRNLPRTSR